LNLIFMHMVKPWYLGMAAAEREALDAALGGPKDLPLVLMGDFNAAPWSRRMRQVEQKHGLRHAPFPVATWPVEAGPFGLPIDHVLVRGRAELVSVDPWGAHLGSNHRGLKAKLALQRTMP
jgi:endonuclease/exonuclease/phosphatase (EEP) superfamily protein YafD